MIYCFDIDDSIITSTNGSYENAEPHLEMISLVNALFNSGHHIILYSALGSNTDTHLQELTIDKLKKLGILYHELNFDKPQGKFSINEKAISVKWFSPSEDDTKQRIGPSAMADDEYLALTYSTEREAYTSYPYLFSKWLLENIYHNPGRLLDIGCGRGEYLSGFQHLGFDVAGLDLSTWAQKVSPQFQVRIADLEKDPLPFPPESFDYVFCKSVIEHMRQPMKLFNEAYRALKPGGVAVIMAPSWTHTYWGPFYIDHTHITPFTAPALADALTLAKFKEVKVSHFYQLPFIWRFPLLKVVSGLISLFPLPYRPFQPAPWPESLNKLIRFSKELMVLGIGIKPNS